MRPAWSDPTAALGAAALAGLIAAGADLVADGDPTHTLTLGLAAVALGALRLHPRGHSRGAVGAATVALLSQPVLHVSTPLIPTFAAGADPPLVTHGLAETPIGVAQLIAASLVVVSVMSAAPLLRLYSRRRTMTTAGHVPSPSWDVALPPDPALRLRRGLGGTGQRLGLRAPPVQPAA